MFFWVRHALQRLRKRQTLGIAVVLAFLALALLGNALCYYHFDRAVKPELTFWDALWYSAVSITTIGYGDFFAVTPGARIGMLVFVVGLGLTSFTALLGLLVDRMMQINFKEVRGLATVHCKDHILLINFPDAVRVEQIIEEFRRDAEFKKRDVVIITDALETLPFDRPNIFFVKGSPLQAETLERAGLSRARLAMVLADSHNPSSDGLVAAIINLIEHLNPDVKTVAECLDVRHSVLFRSTRCDSIVYAHRLLNNLLVQEVQDSGIAAVVAALTSNENKANFYSCTVDDKEGVSYLELAKSLMDTGDRLVTVTRDDHHHINLVGLNSKKGDVVTYLGENRRPWSELAAR
jgi:voltage-gated potassium channel